MKEDFHLRQNSCRKVLSHNSGLSITALIRSILQSHFPNVFPAGRNTALMVV